MRRISALLVLLLSFLLGISTVFAQNGTWKTDRAHTKILFNATHMVISEVTGRFKDFEITVVQRKEDFTDAELTAVIKVNSIDTDNERRDGHLRSADFFDAEKNPEITFKSTSFEKSGKNTYKIEGDLTIRGVTKSVVFDARLNGQIKEPNGNLRAGFRATTSINRYEFGVKWNRALDTGGWLVGENIDITVNIEIVKQAQG